MTPEFICARLARPRQSKERGDVATAMHLLKTGSLQPFTEGLFGSIPSSGIPYEKGAGAPGGQVQRTSAAVLVPLVNKESGFTVVLTKRTTKLRKHAGQVAFPGGKHEECDIDATACALREAEEEIGLTSNKVHVAGQLDSYLTITGFQVAPIVGIVEPPFTPVPDPLEVADVFEVPLSFFLEPANHQRVRRTVKGLDRAYFAMPYDGHYIWGATAGMLLNLYEVLTD